MLISYFMAKSRIKKSWISSHFSDKQFRMYILCERVRTHLYLMLLVLTSVVYVSVTFLRKSEVNLCFCVPV